MSTTLDRIMAVKLKESTIQVAEWEGVNVGCREMTAAQRVAFGEGAKKSTQIAMARLVIECTFDPENGKALFEKAHQDTLLDKSGAALIRVSDEICRLSGLTDKAADELEKN